MWDRITQIIRRCAGLGLKQVRLLLVYFHGISHQSFRIAESREEKIDFQMF